MEKDEIRSLVRRLKRAHTAAQLAAMSEAAVSRLMSQPAISRARTVLMYYPLADEVDVRTAIDRLADGGKAVLLPRVTGPATMELRRYTSPRSLARGAYGIMEPTGETFTDLRGIDAAVVPGMAFDTSGNRLGRGRGYYDRLLPTLTRATTIGICFPFQIMPHIPTDPHDVPVDLVITFPETRK